MILKQDNNDYVAHVRTTDKKIQTLKNHLLKVAEITKQLATKINASEAGELIGLLHDFGKYSAFFQNYIQSGMIFTGNYFVFRRINIVYIVV